MSAELVREYLMTHGVAYRTSRHPVAYSSQDVAEAEHVPGHQVAKPVMLKTGERLVMVVVPAPDHVDLTKAKEVLGTGDVRLAWEEEFEEIFEDCERGAEPPLGNLYGVKVYVDSRLVSPEITFRGGTHTDTITMTLEDYKRIVRPDIADLASGI